MITDQTELVAEDGDPVVEAVMLFIACGHIVEADDDFENWRLDGGEWLTAGDLLAKAIMLGLNPTLSRMQ